MAKQRKKGKGAQRSRNGFSKQKKFSKTKAMYIKQFILTTTTAFSGALGASVLTIPNKFIKQGANGTIQIINKVSEVSKKNALWDVNRSRQERKEDNVVPKMQTNQSSTRIKNEDNIDIQREKATQIQIAEMNKIITKLLDENNALKDENAALKSEAATPTENRNYLGAEKKQLTAQDSVLTPKEADINKLNLTDQEKLDVIFAESYLSNARKLTLQVEKIKNYNLSRNKYKNLAKKHSEFQQKFLKVDTELKEYLHKTGL